MESSHCARGRRWRAAAAFACLLAGMSACGGDPQEAADRADLPFFGENLFDSGSIALDVAAIPEAGASSDGDAGWVDAQAASADQGAGDALPPLADGGPDAADDDAEPACTALVGCPCAIDGDCNSGKCAWQVDGSRICAEVCTDKCPVGSLCVPASPEQTDLIKYCLAERLTLCDPCDTNEDCVHPGDPYAACIDSGPGAGRFCGTWCNNDAACPAGYTCQQTQDADGNGVVQCVPQAGAACSCSGRAMALELSTSCGQGPCAGKRVCLADGKPGAPAGGGLTPCGGAKPVPESCDGLDNDCDGATDEAACDDGKPCTKDVCDPSTGCGHDPIIDGPCDDGDACTSGDTCDDQGVCQAEKKDCSDGQACTEDTCDAKTGACTQTPMADGAGCQDGDGCTGPDTCDKGVCKPGSKKNCDDNNPCTTDSCDATSGLCLGEPVADGEPCEDGQPCTVDDQCKAGKCVAGGEKACPSTNPCVTTFCDPANGQCQNKIKADGEACAGGDKCVSQSTCAKGVCAGGVPASCDDANPCTVDTCVPQTGCVFAAKQAGTACSDGDACTAGDACAVVQAVAQCVGKTKDCGDAKPCTLDTCDPKTGACNHAAMKVGEKCDDGSLCTFSDVCVLASGTLACAGQPVPCDDGDVCTADSCVAGTGACKFAPIAGCQTDVCKTNLDCDDGDLCTTDTCLKTGKCAHSPKPGCCQRYDVSLGNEAVDPKYTTSSESLVDVTRSPSDGSSVAVGYVYAGAAGGTQALVVRRDPQGKLLWANQHGAVNNTLSDYLWAVAPRTDGSVWTAGYTYNAPTAGSADGWVLRLDAYGKVVQSKTFGGAKTDLLYAAAPWGKNGVVLAGRKYVGGAGGDDAWVLWLDAAGNPAGPKERTFGTADIEYLRAIDVHPLTGQIALAGYRYVTGKSNQGLLATISTSGAVQTLELGGTASETLTAVRYTKTGGIAAVGMHSAGSHGGSDGWLVTTSATLTGTKTWDFGGSKADRFDDLAIGPNGWLFAVGSTQSTGKGSDDGWALSIDPGSGKQVGAALTWGGPASDTLAAVAPDIGEHWLLAGRSYSKAPTADTWQLKVDAAGSALCGGGACTTAAQCDDANPCTADSCVAQKCAHVPTIGASCGGGKICDAAAVCVCLGYDLTYGNEEQAPVYTTSSEYLYAVLEPNGSTDALAAGYVYNGPAQGAYQGLAIRRDKVGKLLWAKQYGGAKNDYFRALAPTSDGGAWAVGYSDSPGTKGGYDGWAVRLSASGAQLTQVQHGTALTSEYLYDAVPYGKDGFVAAGRKTVGGVAASDMWVLWMDATGAPTGPKERVFGGTGSQYASALAYDAASGWLIVAGYEAVSGLGNQGLLAAVHASNALLPIKKALVGGSGSEVLNAVLVLPGGKVVAAGYTTTATKGSNDGLIVRAGVDLSAPKTTSVGSAASDVFHDLFATANGDVVAVGYSGAKGSNDGWAVPISASTGLASGQEMSWGGAKSDYLYAGARTTADTFLFAGQNYSKGANGDTWQLETDKKGAICGQSAGCNAAADCSDGNDCTTDSCNAGSCVHTPAPGAPCGKAMVCSDKATCVCATWSQTWGNEQSAPVYTTSTEYLWSVVPAAQGGGTFAVGYVYSGAAAGGNQGLVLRRDATGALLWSRQYGSTVNSASDYLYAGARRSDGGIWAAGYSYDKPSAGGADGWLLRLDPAGKVLWQGMWGGSGTDTFVAAAPWSGDGVVVAGTRNAGGTVGAEAWVRWFDAAGKPSGPIERTFGGAGSQALQAVAVDPLTGITLVGGYGSVTGLSNQALLGTISKAGTVQSKLLGGTGSEVVRGLALLPGGKVAAVGGTSTGSSGPQDGLYVRTDTALSAPALYKLGAAKYDVLYGVAVSPTGGLVAVGYTDSSGAGGYDGWAVAFDASTAKQAWSRTWGGAQSDAMYGIAAVPTGYALVGRATSYPPSTSNADTWQVNVDAGGNVLCK